MFDNPITIYLDGIVRLTGTFKKPVVMNYVSRTSAHTGVISSLLPEGVAGIGLLDDTDDDPKGKTVEPFVDFGGFAFRKALEAARPAPAPQSSGTRRPPLRGR